MAKYVIDIQADAMVLFKLMQIKQMENLLNEALPLDAYLSPQSELKEIRFELSALGQFSLSKKPEKIKRKGQKVIVLQTNIEPESIKEADEVDLLEVFSDIFIEFLEELDDSRLNKKQLMADYIDRFLTQE